MNFIVVDFEWNQSNTGNEPDAKRLPFEIIEIGAIKLNEDCQVLSEFNEIVKPQVYTEMHFMTSKIIKLQMEDLLRGEKFQIVGDNFLKWCGEDYIFCSWGSLDLLELQRNLRYYGMPELGNGPVKYLDVQKLFSRAYEDSKSRRALEYAVDLLEIEKDIPFHRAFSDAYYTSKILTRICETNPEVLDYVSYDIYNAPKSKEDEIKVVFETYTKYITRCFEEKSEIMGDKEISSSKCYICHRNLRKKIRWFTPNGKHYYCVAYCEKHGYLKCKVRAHKNEEGMYFAVKTTKLVGQDEVDKIYYKREHSRLMHKSHRQKKL